MEQLTLVGLLHPEEYQWHYANYGYVNDMSTKKRYHILANPTSKVYPDGMIDVRCTVCNAIHKVKKD